MTDILDTIDDLDDFDDEDALSGELVEMDENELAYEMNEDEAQEITDAIRSAATATYILLARAHQQKAYKALGYETWAEYVREEFEISPQRSYQLLDLSKAVAMIEEAAPEGTKVKLTEAQARDIKRELPHITEEIREATREKTPEEAEEEINRIIEEQREQKKADDKVEKDKEKAAEDEEEEERQAGLEAAADSILEADRPEGMTDSADDGLVEFDVEGEGSDDENISPENSMALYNFFTILSNLDSLPDPDDFIDIIPNSRVEEINNQLMKVTSWFNRFQTLWEVREEED